MIMGEEWEAHGPNNPCSRQFDTADSAVFVKNLALALYKVTTDAEEASSEVYRLREGLREAQETINQLGKQIHQLTGKKVYKVVFDFKEGKLLTTNELLED